MIAKAGKGFNKFWSGKTLVSEQMPRPGNIYQASKRLSHNLITSTVTGIATMYD